MMHKFFLATFLALIVAALAATFGAWIDSDPQVVNAKEISRNARGELIYHGKLFTGEVVSYHTPKQIASSDQYVDGRRQGYAKYWFENGVKASEIYYEGGRREGLAQFWWLNGTLKTETFYIRGKKEGEVWSWYQSGAKYKRANFSQGRPTGIQQAWRENGDLFANFEYKNGRVYGLNKADTCMGVKNEKLSSSYYKDQGS